jgi:DNA polymerase-4
VLGGSRAGLARHPLAALGAATLAPPGTLHLLPPGGESAGLAPLPLAGLPGLPASRRRLLHTLRIETLGDLAGLPPAVLARDGGPDLLALQALARGENRASCAPHLPDGGATFVGSSRFWAWAAVPAPPAPLTPVVALIALGRAAETLATRLIADGQAAVALTLTVGFVDGPSATQHVPLTLPSDDGGALLRAATPALARLLRAHRRRPAWVQLAVPRWRGAIVQPLLTGLPAPV